MKRSPLKRKPRVKRDEPGRDAWKASKAGPCQCGCHRFSMHLERHHVIELQRIRQEGRDDLAWDLRNSMLLHPHCHGRHTSAMHRIAIERIPEEALAFAVDLLGEDRAALYIARYYDGRRSWAA